MKETLKIGFAGNPNCGKTTLFNAYTGANLKVANWPGVTVEKKEGAMRFHDSIFKLVDLPGTYSLTSYTLEEKISRQYILSDDVDVIINIVDASSLERNLYLTLQLIELGKPVILALNMMDIVAKRGMEIDTHRLPEMLGIPVIPVSARKKTGLDILMHAAAHHKQQPHQSELIHNHAESTLHHHNHHTEYAMVYSDEIEDKIDIVMEQLHLHYPDITNYRWHAIKLLEQDLEIIEKYPLDLPEVLDKSYEDTIIGQKYSFIEEIVAEILVNKASKEASTDKADSILTNKFLGLPIFLGIMGIVFLLTFLVGDWLKAYFEIMLNWFSIFVRTQLTAIHTNDLIASLIVDGIIAGVGGILTFLPNLFILFLALAFLEDSGYMSRVAYVMDGIMSKFGLSGRAFIPMILGFGCTVPAIMASRTLENSKDRFKVMLITPFMSCSAKLPIYILFSEMFFEKSRYLIAYSLYLLGILIAVIVAVIAQWITKSTTSDLLLIELPEYKAPSTRTIFIYVWEKVKGYLFKAGTIIFIASIFMWLLLNIGPTGFVTDMSQSFGSLFGKIIVPFFKPIGLGYWQIIVAIIAGITAKEVVVSSSSVLFGITNINSQAGISSMVSALTAIGFGSANAYALMVFCLLYVPCTASLATIKRESNSWRWTLFVAVFQIAVAWVVTFIVYHMSSTLAVALVLLILVILVMRKLIRDKKSGKCCGCSQAGNCSKSHCN